MDNSAEKKNPEVFTENKIGGSHCRKSLISLNNQPNTTHQKTKQNKNLQSQKMRSDFSVRSRRLRGLFPIASRRNLCKQRSGEERFGS